MKNKVGWIVLIFISLFVLVCLINPEIVGMITEVVYPTTRITTTSTTTTTAPTTTTTIISLTTTTTPSTATTTPNGGGESISTTTMMTSSTTTVLSDDGEVTTTTIPVSSTSTTTVLSCPSSCDDGNPCTIDYCSASTGYECLHDAIIPCCGNNNCEEGEDYDSCPDDCREARLVMGNLTAKWWGRYQNETKINFYWYITNVGNKNLAPKARCRFFYINDELTSVGGYGYSNWVYEKDGKIITEYCANITGEGDGWPDQRILVGQIKEESFPYRLPEGTYNIRIEDNYFNNFLNKYTISSSINILVTVTSVEIIG